MSDQQKSHTRFGKRTTSEKLPPLLAELAHADHLYDRPGRTREELCWLQVEAARGAWRVAYRMGKINLSRLALSRMRTAAAESGDPRQVAVERWMRAQTSMESGSPGVEVGLRLVHQALRDLDGDGDKATRAVRGALHLKGSILASRQSAKDAADGWLQEAQGIARDTGETRDYELVFGPTNVALHVISAASNRNQHGKALAAARKVHLSSDYPPSRAAAYWMDRARAEMWTAHHDEAFESLMRARKMAPQQTRYHPTTRETTAALRRARARVPDPVREFSLWCGI